MRQQAGVCEDNFPAIKKGLLDEDEIEVACTLFMRRLMTENMWNEYRSLENNSQLVLTAQRPEVPFYAFISDQNEADWKNILVDYSDKSYMLDADHYLHLDEAEFIAERIIELVE